MLRKKCPRCSNKISKKFDYCPYCGTSFKRQREEDDFGMLGRDDIFREVQNQVKMPFGLNKIMDSLIKQLGKQFSELDEFNNPSSNQNNPGGMRGFKIQISTGKPPKIEQLRNNNNQSQSQKNKDSFNAKQEKEISIKQEKISEKEMRRRRTLPMKDAESIVRRLSDRIIYEISVPGVKDKKDITITKLEDGIEIRAYSKLNCFFKSLPIKAEILRYYLDQGRLFFELKN